MKKWQPELHLQTHTKARRIELTLELSSGFQTHIITHAHMHTQHTPYTQLQNFKNTNDNISEQILHF